MENREHNSINWSTVSTAVEVQEEVKQYYEAMHGDY